MTERIGFNVNSFRIFHGLSISDDPVSGDRDDFRLAPGFFITFGVEPRSAGSTSFGSDWARLRSLTVYFSDPEAAGFGALGVVNRSWRGGGGSSERETDKAYTFADRAEFGPMRDWLATDPSLRMALFGENGISDVARYRIYGPIQRF